MKNLNYKQISTTLILCIFSFLISFFIFHQKNPLEHFSNYKISENREQKIELLNKYISSLPCYGNPNGKSLQENTSTCTTGLSILANEYKSTEDEIILDTIDNLSLRGGFTNDVCGLIYSKIDTIESFKERYRKKENIEKLKRCEGISYSKDEVTKILNQ